MERRMSETRLSDSIKRVGGWGRGGRGGLRGSRERESFLDKYVNRMADLG